MEPSTLIVDFLSQTLSLIVAAGVAAGLAFRFNEGLQKSLLKEQNKNKLLDDLLRLLDEQSNYYGNYWDPQNDQEFRAETNDTRQLTRFYAILKLVEEKYQLNDKDKIFRQYRHFYHISTGGDTDENFGPSIQKNNKKVLEIHAAANELSMMLLQNKF